MSGSEGREMGKKGGKPEKRGLVWDIGAGLESLFCLKTVQVVASNAVSGFQHPNGGESTSCLVGTLQD